VLAAHPCQAACDWARTGRVDGGRRLFRCAGCGSEWTAAEPWTPAQADGTVPPAVAAERHLTTEHLTTEHLTTEHLTTEHLTTEHLTTEHLTTERGGDEADTSDRSRTNGS
jgi:hypothetical protein